MALADWPTTLPRYPNMEGLTVTMPKLLLSSPMDQGPPKVRRQTTANYWPVSCIYDLSDAQAAILVDFVHVTLAGGALPFNWFHPLYRSTAQACVARFDPDNPVAWAPASGDAWLAALRLMIIP
jgi:hypothetical protein